MKISNKRGEINLSKWVEKVKDSYDLIKSGYKCVLNYCTYYSSVLPYMSKGLCTT